MDPAASTPAGLLLAGLIAGPLALAAAWPIWWRIQRPALPAVALTVLEAIGFVLLHGEGTAVFSAQWIPSVGVALAFRLDGLAYLFCLLVTGIGAAILFYSSAYVPHDFEKTGSERRLSTYYCFLLLFMGSMLGLVCADDLVTLYVFWEATTISSFLLIGIHIHKEEARESALQSLVITGGGGLVLFVGLLALTQHTGTASIPAVLAASREIGASPVALGITFCILVGVSAKSAQMPFHPWLPAAMVAPTPVSAFLHSATMVAAGVFLLTRLGPLVGALPALSTLLKAIGSATMILGGLIASRRSRLKEILAWSTISQYGYITLLLGLEAWGAASFFMASHAVLKAGLFLSAGSITHSTGEDDIDRLGGLWRSYPVTALTTFVLALGLGGLPATSGFWMKELLYREVVDVGSPWLETGSVLAGVLTLTYMLRYAGRIFLGTRPPDLEGPDRLVLPTHGWLAAYRGLGRLLVPTFLLALIAVAVGIVPALGTHFTDPAASSAARQAVSTPTTLHWPPDRALWLGVATYLLGALAAAWLLSRDRSLGHLEPGPLPPQPIPAYSPATLLLALTRSLGANSLYHHLLRGTEGLGRIAAARLQTGKLLHYLLFLIALPVVLAACLFPSIDTWLSPWPVATSQQATLAFGALAVAATGLGVASAVVRSHVASILLVGGVGFLLSVVFSLLRAPDVALVQVTVETVSALLLVVALGQLPYPLREQAFAGTERRTAGTHLASIVVSISLAATVTAAVLAIQPALGDPTLAKSYFPLTAEEGAESVVSTILTDFRSVDTLGEVSVFAAAAIGTALLLGRRRKGGPGHG